METPDGKSAPAKLVVLRPGAFAEENEDNGGFAKPQPITLPATMRGRIQAAQDVDVFAFEGKAGQRVLAEILAARLGSPLDATLTLWNSSNTLLASADDSPATATRASTSSCPPPAVTSSWCRTRTIRAVRRMATCYGCVDRPKLRL